MWRDSENVERQLQWASVDLDDWEYVDSDVFPDPVRRKLFNIMHHRKTLEQVTTHVAEGVFYRFRWAPEDTFIAALVIAQTEGK